MNSTREGGGSECVILVEGEGAEDGLDIGARIGMPAMADL